MKTIGKYFLAGLLILTGMALTIYGNVSGQNAAFNLSSLGITLAGIVMILLIAGLINRTVSFIVGGVFLVGSIALATTTVDVIMGPLNFKKERDMRYSHVQQRLKDIRTAQIMYKSVKGFYTHSFDSLLNFIKHDSVPVVIKNGRIPDGMTREMAIDSGYLVIEEKLIPAIDTTFHAEYLNDPLYVGKFYVDSLPYIPFTKGVKFEMQASQIDKNGVWVPVFQVKDIAPFDSTKQLVLGSMSEPSTSGNWD